MQNKRSPQVNQPFGLALVIGGMLLALLSLFADIIGLGSNPDLFGRRQFIGTVVGMLMFVAGFMVLLGKPKDQDSQLSLSPKRPPSRLPSPTKTPPKRVIKLIQASPNKD